jgi:hypothetical protein
MIKNNNNNIKNKRNKKMMDKQIIYIIQCIFITIGGSDVVVKILEILNKKIKIGAHYAFPFFIFLFSENAFLKGLVILCYIYTKTNCFCNIPCTASAE